VIGLSRCSIKSYIELLKREVKENQNTGFTEQVLDLSYVIWQKLKNLFEETKDLTLETPTACPGSKDNFMYTWTKMEHYLECEIFGSGEIEFFYRNRKTGENWGKDTTLEEGFSKDILHYLTLFAQDVILE
jgi:hypothetical protein